MPKGEEASRAEGRPRSCEQGCARPRPGDCVAGCGDSCAQSGGTASLASHELRIPAWRDSRARRLPQRPSRSSFLHSRPRGTTNVNAAVLLVEASDDGTRAARSGTTSTCAAVRRYNVSIHSLVLTYFQFLKYKATTNAGAATQRHLVNRGRLGLLPARTHVLGPSASSYDTLRER